MISGGALQRPADGVRAVLDVELLAQDFWHVILEPSAGYTHDGSDLGSWLLSAEMDPAQIYFSLALEAFDTSR